MTMSKNSIAVLGAGGWGLAISNLLCGKGYNVRLWEFDPDATRELNETRVLPKKLPGVRLAEPVFVTDKIAEAVADAFVVAFAVPSQTMRPVAQKFASLKLTQFPMLVNLAKGIEVDTLKRMSEVLEEAIPEESRRGVATISGPSHAEEVARNIPTAVVAASKEIGIAREIQEIFMTPRFRVYTSADILGVELAGSLKNIIALAAGMLDGLEMGDNTRGALLTRGLAEIARIGKNLGADPMTFSGLSGIGDLVTTCLSKHSRNRFVGEQIGRGRKLKTILSHMTMVAEGVDTTKSGLALSQRQGVEMPITAEVHKVLFENKAPIEAIDDLMVRGPKPERWY